MTLVSFSCCELHRGITTYSQLVATSYSQERKNPRATRGKRLLKPYSTCSFVVRHSLMATDWENQKSRYLHTLMVLAVLSHVLAQNSQEEDSLCSWLCSPQFCIDF